MILHDCVKSLLPDCVKIRQELHQIPETGFEEFQTSDYLYSFLSKLHPDKLDKYDPTGIRAVFYSENPIDTIAFRSDIDALHILENTTHDFRSKREGYMHACGHDGHMTTMLLLATLVSSQRKELKSNVVFIFQPAEEGYGGARIMIEHGALKDPDVDRIYAFHVWPTVPYGKIGVREGAQMAQVLEFDIHIHGKSSHAASPQLGKDCILAAAELILLLQSVITRNRDPHQDAVLGIGQIEGGVARNIIADEVLLRATMRTRDEQLFDHLLNMVENTMKGVSIASGCEISLEKKSQYPCLNNSKELMEDMISKLDLDDYQIVEPVMQAEDFAFYEKEVPGLLMFLGINDGKRNHGQPLHSNTFDFDESALLYGVEACRRILGLCD